MSRPACRAAEVWRSSSSALDALALGNTPSLIGALRIVRLVREQDVNEVKYQLEHKVGRDGLGNESWLPKGPKGVVKPDEFTTICDELTQAVGRLADSKDE